MLKCSFIEGPILHRLKYGKGRGQNLAKAVGMKSNKNRTIIDATAGLGYDAFILASLGANVTLIERSKIMHNLLQEGISEAKSFGGEISGIINRMNLIFGDSKFILPDLLPEVILIDTMYKDRKKTALVKNDNIKPYSHQILGKTIRYDVYMTI